MIGFFPEPYPDELVYSWLARYFAHSGYMGYSYVAEDLFIHKWNRPDVEFVNAYTVEAVQAMTRSRSMEEIVMQHTMFPFYGRFLPLDRRPRAFDTIAQMRDDIHDQVLIPTSKRGKQRFLRYCPLCAEHDHEVYGETYWHRIHQMRGADICPLHGCYLHSSTVLIGSMTAPSLVSAEEACDDRTADCLADEKTVSIVRYMAEVFNQPVNMASASDIGQFLHSRLTGTPYVSVRGQQRHMSRLFADFREFYAGYNACRIRERWQLEKVFYGQDCSFPSVCLAAFFLEIPAADLTDLTLPAVSQQEEFDARVHGLRRQGLSYPHIAKEMHCSINVVKPIGEGRYGSIRGSKNRKGGRKVGKLHEEDEALLPVVKKAVETIRGEDGRRPGRVTVNAVTRMLELPSKKLERLPLCMRAIRQQKETQEQYWAREVVWAAEQVIERGQEWNWTNIRKLTNMRRTDFAACYSHIPLYMEAGLMEKLRALLPDEQHP